MDDRAWTTPFARTLAVTLAFVTGFGATVLCSDVQACEPPMTTWYVPRVFPTPGSTDAPLNGIVVVQLEFLDESGASQWPEQAVIDETLNIWMTREEEVVEGTLEFDRTLREARFTASLPMAEGIEYSVHIESLNSYWGYSDRLDTVSFTTGNRFDEVGPAFSGLQSLGLTEHSVAAQQCCESTEDYCLGMCGACVWCWTTGWEYLPLARLSFRSSEDEFGARSVRYVIYELESPDAALGTPRHIHSPDVAGEETINLTVEGAGPHCFTVRAHDAYGRWDNNSTVMCVDSEDLEPIDRLAVPPPDRTYCADTGEDVGFDGGTPDTGAPDSGDERDAGVTNPDGGDLVDAGPTAVNTTSNDDGCGCAVPAAPKSAWPTALGALMLLAGLRLRTLTRR